ncbi:MAG: universal stress protein [Pseudomonadota bacterium]
MAGKSKGERLLLALDGSDAAFETVKYVSRMDPLKSIQMLLFAVFSKIRESYWDLEKEPVYNRKLGEIRAWETRRETELEDYMRKAKKILLDSGFPKESVDIKLHERNKGIARDIIDEAKKGYGALVVGRKGVSRVRGIVLGSVATKLLEGISTIPVWMIGRGPRPEKILIALDGSEGSLRAVDYVGALLGGFQYEISLTNVMRDEEKDRIAKVEHFTARAFDDAIERLTVSGIARTRISTQVITGAPSRAQAIVKEATQGGYGTIVVGKRGLSDVRDFHMGTVTGKVVQLATGQAVWVVN